MNIKRIVLVIFIISAISITFAGNYSTLVREFEDEAHAKEISIKRYIELSNTFIELMTIYGNEYFRQSKNIDSDLYSLLKYDTVKDIYSLDAAERTKYRNKVGNLTGTGRIPQKGINRDELNLALKYNEFFHDFYERLEGVRWLSYRSENGFANIFPWVASGEYAFSESEKANEYYSLAGPKKNPHRRVVWTPVYYDHVGKESVVTLSSPIYYGGNFMGVISLDISTAYLKQLLSGRYENYMIDVKNSIIAANSHAGFSTSFDRKTIQPHTVQRFGMYYIHYVDFEKVPWRLFCMVPVGDICLKAALSTLPVLAIGVLLYLAFFGYEKNRSIRILLQNSMENLKSYHKLLEDAAKYDFLTNTYNRRGLKENFEKALSLGNIIKTPISFIIGDVDNFKQFNDKFGHAAGDKVLTEYSGLIKKNIRDNDILCRWGGEEFVIMLFDRTYDEAMKIAERIRTKIGEAVIPFEDPPELRGTMTFGVVEYDYGESLEESILKADKALYVGKEKGRNRTEGYRDCYRD